MKQITKYIFLAFLIFDCLPNVMATSQVDQVNDTLKAVKKLEIACNFSLFPQDTSYLEYIFGLYDLVNIKQIDSTIQIDLRYADTNNFLHRNFYDGLRNAYLTCFAAVKLASAQTYLKKENPNYSLMVLDAARPLHIQQLMWDSVKMPLEKKARYLTPVSIRSLHNYGVAVDLTIVDLKTNKPLDMGTEFDYFGKLSQPIFEPQFLSTKEISQDAINNRKLLRRVMKNAGFKSISTEWWHFIACDRNKTLSTFELIK